MKRFFIILAASALCASLAIAAILYMPVILYKAELTKLKHLDHSDLVAETPTILQRHIWQNNPEPFDRTNLPPSIARYQPQEVYLYKSNIYLWWGDHWKQHGLRFFTTEVDTNAALTESDFERTFSCTRITNKVWLYLGD